MLRGSLRAHVNLAEYPLRARAHVLRVTRVDVPGWVPRIPLFRGLCQRVASPECYSMYAKPVSPAQSVKEINVRIGLTGRQGYGRRNLRAVQRIICMDQIRASQFVGAVLSLGCHIASYERVRREKASVLKA